MKVKHFHARCDFLFGNRWEKDHGFNKGHVKSISENKGRPMFKKLHELKSCNVIIYDAVLMLIYVSIFGLILTILFYIEVIKNLAR